MALSYDINTVLNIDSQGVTINALGAEVGVAGDAYEMAFFGVANFLNGNYTQDSADVNDINSTVTVNEAALNNAHFFYVADVSGSGTDVYPGGGESDYGANITQTGTIFGSGAVTHAADGSNTAVAIVPRILAFSTSKKPPFSALNLNPLPATSLANPADSIVPSLRIII